MVRTQIHANVRSTTSYESPILGTYDLPVLPPVGTRIVLKARDVVGDIEPGTQVYGYVAATPEATVHADSGLVIIFLDNVRPMGA